MHQRPWILVALIVGFAAVAQAEISDPDPSPAGEHIQPGAAVYNMPSDAYGAELHRAHCSLNYVYDSTVNNSTYIATAGHCFNPEGSWGVDVGQNVYRRNDAVMGNVVYRIHNDTSLPFMDIMLINVTANEEDVRASVYGHSSVPTGYTTPDDVATDDLVRAVGYMGTDETTGTPLHDDRVGILNEQDDDHYCTAALSYRGDSGGAIYHIDTGWAIGSVKGMNMTSCVGNPAGPTVQAVTAHLGDAGFQVEMRTV